MLVNLDLYCKCIFLEMGCWFSCSGLFELMSDNDKLLFLFFVKVVD